MFVLDTDILTLLFAGHSRVVNRRNQVSSTDIATTVVSRIQSLLGRYQFLLKAANGPELLRAQRLLDGTMRALGQIETEFSVDDAAAAQETQEDRQRRPADRCYNVVESRHPGNAQPQGFPSRTGLADRKLGRLTLAVVRGAVPNPPNLYIRHSRSERHRFVAETIKSALPMPQLHSVELSGYTNGRRPIMNRRRFSFLMAAIVLAGGLTSCSARRTGRVNYVGPPPGIGPCDRCTTNGPMPPRFVPNTGPVPAVPAPAGVAVPAPAAGPFAPGPAAPPGAPPMAPAQAIQQNNYVPPGATPPPSPPASVPKVYLEQPEPVVANPETRSYPPQTQEPPRARDDRAASPVMPVDIPQFAAVKTNIANGQEPFPGGIAWLKSHSYRTVLHVRAPGEDDSAVRKQFEQSGLRYLSLEVSPQTLSQQTVDQFKRVVTDTNNLPLFVYDKDGSLAGALWYLYFRLVDKTAEEKARADAEHLGFKQERSDAHLKMWLAVQKLL